MRRIRKVRTLQNKKARTRRAFLRCFCKKNQLPLAGLILAFLSAFSSVRTREALCLPFSFPADLAFFPFFPFVSEQEDLAEQQLLAASAFPWQQEDLLLVHSVLDLDPVQELL